jgi:hypothetical protein
MAVEVEGATQLILEPSTAEIEFAPMSGAHLVAKLSSVRQW